MERCEDVFPSLAVTLRAPCAAILIASRRSLQMLYARHCSGRARATLPPSGLRLWPRIGLTKSQASLRRTPGLKPVAFLAYATLKGPLLYVRSVHLRSHERDVRRDCASYSGAVTFDL